MKFDPLTVPSAVGSGMTCSPSVGAAAAPSPAAVAPSAGTSPSVGAGVVCVGTAVYHVASPIVTFVTVVAAPPASALSSATKPA